MPLLTSPIDGSPMRQINRYGIEIDVCPTSGGVWLDRGELEKIMAILQEDDDDDHRKHANHPHPSQHGHPAHHAPPPQYRPHYDDDDYKKYGHKSGYKKSKISRVMDIFDF